MHHTILLRFEFILIALAKIANHNKYTTNRYPVKQQKAEDILSSCLFCKNWERFYLQKCLFCELLFLFFFYVIITLVAWVAAILRSSCLVVRTSGACRAFGRCLFLHLLSYIFLPDFML